MLLQHRDFFYTFLPGRIFRLRLGDYCNNSEQRTDCYGKIATFHRGGVFQKEFSQQLLLSGREK